MVGQVHLGLHRSRPARDFDNDGVNVDKVDAATRKAWRRTCTTPRLATRRALFGPPRARRRPGYDASHRALARRAHLARLSSLFWRAEAAAYRRRAGGRTARRRRAVCAHAHRPGARQDGGDTANPGRARGLVDWALTCTAEGHARTCGAHAGDALGRVGDSETPVAAE